jgi:hypothetical protein
MLLQCCVIHLLCGELLLYMLQGLVCFLSEVTAGLRTPFSFLLYWYVLFFHVSHFTRPRSMKCCTPHLFFF